ncbi:MAG: hypothetical protein V4722_21500 [Bacteroidota bacterium]
MDVKLFIEGLGAHSSQIFTGFGLLETAGLVRLTFMKGRNYRPLRGIVCAEFDNRRIVYDLGDNPETVMEEYYRDADFYFKRMAQQHIISKYPKILPMGLNYPVYDPSDRYLKRAFIMKEKLSVVRAMLNKTSKLSDILGVKSASASSRLDMMQAFPNPMQKPKVIFAGRLWNQFTSDELKNAERNTINNQRIEIVRLLKKRFNENFVGGIVEDEFSKKVCPESVLPRNTFTEKGSYNKHLLQCSIGIATPGLETSVGFKFAEYIAFSKAIVTTPINAIVPGKLQAGSHYSVYNDPEACLGQVERLMNDNELRKEMMENNFAYYQQYLRPDKLVWNTILNVHGYQV